MAALTPRNIVQTTSDLEGLVIHSEEGKTKIPSMYLLDQLSANLTNQLNHLSNILNLNEIKWLGVSTTNPLSGSITINGITYSNDDIDNGNYVTYTAPGTSAELKYIFGHGIWESIGDIVNLPANFISNYHINQYAAIDLEKIAGLDLVDLSNSTYVLSDVTNLKTTLKAMVRDYKQVDINTIISEVQGNVNNTINLVVNGEIANLSIDQKFEGISGSVFNTLNLCMENVYDELNIDIDQQFKDIRSVVNNNNLCIEEINSQVANVNENVTQYYSDINDIVNSNSTAIGQIISEYSNLNGKIAQYIDNVSGDIISYNNISSKVSSVVANISSNIESIITESIIETLNMVGTIDSKVQASCANVYNTITSELYEVSAHQMTLMGIICSDVSAASAYVENTIGTTFNNCNISSIASYDDIFYTAVGAYPMRYCGDYESFDEANDEITTLSNCVKEYTFPKYDTKNNTLTTDTQRIPFTVYLIEKGSVIGIGNPDNGYEYYMCTGVPATRSQDNKNYISWRPLVDNKIYVKRNDISVITELPEDDRDLEDGKFYVVVDPE